jgi:hypothetical protein
MITQIQIDYVDYDTQELMASYTTHRSWSLRYK